jgi:hypothetical protein
VVPGVEPSCLSSISAKKLSDGLSICRTMSSAAGESAAASAVAPLGASPSAGLPRTLMSRSSSSASRRVAANTGGLRWNADPRSFAKPRL